jgi:hypothetical protein
MDKILLRTNFRVIAACSLAAAITFFLMVVLKEGIGVPGFWSPDSWVRGWLGGIYCTSLAVLLFRTANRKRT